MRISHLPLIASHHVFREHVAHYTEFVQAEINDLAQVGIIMFQVRGRSVSSYRGQRVPFIMNSTFKLSCRSILVSSFSFLFVRDDHRLEVAWCSYPLSDPAYWCGRMLLAFLLHLLLRVAVLLILSKNITAILLLLKQFLLSFETMHTNYSACCSLYPNPSTTVGSIDSLPYSAASTFSVKF